MRSGTSSAQAPLRRSLRRASSPATTTGSRFETHVPELNGDKITELLGELLDRLAARGIAVETHIIGGAAAALHLGGESLTF